MTVIKLGLGTRLLEILHVRKPWGCHFCYLEKKKYNRSACLLREDGMVFGFCRDHGSIVEDFPA